VIRYLETDLDDWLATLHHHHHHTTTTAKC